MSHHTIIKGTGEIKNGRMEPVTRLRKEGGGAVERDGNTISGKQETEIEIA